MADEGRDQEVPPGAPKDPSVADEGRRPTPYRALGPNTSASLPPPPDDLEHAEALEEALGDSVDLTGEGYEKGTVEVTARGE